MIYWGDIHNHNAVGYGKGTMERSYEIARRTLDFYAFTPHGCWPDAPKTDPKVAKAHEDGFKLVADNWDRVMRFANENYRKGEFVSFVAHEWHSSHWGDYCLYFPGDVGEICHASNIEELRTFAKEHEAIMIPHHSAYPKGIRGTDWNEYDNSYSPVVEIFSEHGNSLEPITPFPMVRHSMGGSLWSNNVLSQIINGKVLGFTAGTDNHYGHPGSCNEGLTAVIADELTRESILDALKKRHTYAVSGERIEINAKIPGGRLFGDIVPAVDSFSIDADIQGKSPIDYVELLCNGRSVDKKNGNAIPAYDGDTLSSSYIRLEFGWAGMNDMKGVADWKVKLSARGGKIGKVDAYTSSGLPTIDRIDKIERIDGSTISIETSFSRSNSTPVNMFVLDTSLREDSIMEVDAKMLWNGAAYHKNISLAVSELLEDDNYLMASDSFSAPKIKIHRLLGKENARASVSWTGEELENYRCAPALKNDGEYDTFIIKVVQKNGGSAWTSPIYRGK